jgi:hypothetical protein
MGSRGAGAVALAALGLALAPARGGEPTAGSSHPLCWTAPRIHHPGGAMAAELEAAAARALRIERVAGPLEPPHTLSPNGAYAFRLGEQPLPGPPSGATRVSLLVFTEQPTLLALQADGVRSLQDVRWLNEKLVAFRLWLSRLGGVDALLDVEQERIVWMEAFADGATLWQQARESCRAAPALPGCDAACVTLESVAAVRVSDGSSVREIDAAHAPGVERALRALLASCSTSAREPAASLAAWRAAEAAPSLAVHHSKPTRVRTPDGELEADSILFAPLARDYVRVRRGDAVRAFAKWRPELEAALVCDPSLGLLGHDPVRELCERLGAQSPGTAP